MHDRVRVRTWWAALIAGLATASVVLTLFTVMDVPEQAMNLVGGPTGIERFGGLRMRIAPTWTMDVDTLARVATARGLANHREGARLIVDLPGVARDQATRAAEILAGGGVRFYEVVEDLSLQHAPVVAGLVRDDSATREVRADAVRVWVETWRPESDTASDVHRDAYLYAASREALARVVERLRAADWQPPPHTWFAFEHVPPQRPTGDDLWRSYLLRDQPALDGRAVQHATAIRSPVDGRPSVMLELTPEGREAFGELTARIVGCKLATVIGDEVISAPMINSAIRGGRLTVLGNGRDHDEQDRNVQMMVHIFNTPPLPGGTLEAGAWQAPVDSGASTAIARLVLAGGLGVLVAALAALLVRFVRPVWQPRPARAAGKLPLARIAVTLLAPVSWLVLREIPLGFVFDLPRELYAQPALISIGGLGLSSVISAFILVEVALLCHPRWRAARHVPAFRVSVGRAVAVTALACALLQAHFTTQWMVGLNDLRGMTVLDPSLASRVATTLTLAAATMWLVWIAGVIGRRGLGNGFVALIVADWLLRTVLDSFDMPIRQALDLQTTQVHRFDLTALAAIALATGALLRMRVARDPEPGLRVPTSGTPPILVAMSLPSLVLPLLESFGLRSEVLGAIRGWQQLGIVGVVVTAAVASVAWSFAFARPRVLVGWATRAGVAPPSWATWRRAAALSLIATAWIAAVSHLVRATLQMPPLIAGQAAAAMIATAAVLDWLDEIRIRRAAMVSIGMVHQPQLAEIVVRALRDAGITAALTGSHVRSLLCFFGPYVPIDVWVAPAAADDARAIVARIVTPVTPDAASAAALQA